MNQPPTSTNPQDDQMMNNSQMSSSSTDQGSSYADAYQPPAQSDAPSFSDSSSSTSESLDQQNIFDMLAVADATDDQKESFLDELQQIIWEDFLENDVKMLITDAEQSELNAISAKVYENDLAKQEAIVVYLEKLIPDMEDIMLEKALQLKADLFRDRVSALKQDPATPAATQSTLAQVETAISQEKWATATRMINSTV